MRGLLPQIALAPCGGQPLWVKTLLLCGSCKLFKSSNLCCNICEDATLSDLRASPCEGMLWLWLGVEATDCGRWLISCELSGSVSCKLGPIGPLNSATAAAAACRKAETSAKCRLLNWEHNTKMGLENASALRSPSNGRNIIHVVSCPRGPLVQISRIFASVLKVFTIMPSPMQICLQLSSVFNLTYIVQR